jgi:hypothetical protein
MNKIIAATGLVALSAAGMQAQYAPGLSAQDSSKSWGLTGGFQGFYDSNSTTSPDSSRVESWGIGFDVGASYSLPLDATYFGIDVTYGLKWYEARTDGNTDQSVIMNLRLDHAFSERYDVKVKDSFVYSNQPTVLDAGGAITAPTTLRTDSDSFRNRANIDFGMQMSPKWGLGVGLENTFYQYMQGAGDVANSLVNPSRAQLLDRSESLVPVDVRYTVDPKLTALVGLQYGRTDYLSNDPYLTPYSTSLTDYWSPDWRNSSSVYGYLGAEYSVTSQLNTALKAGAQWTQYDKLNDYGSGLDDDQLTPYVDLSVSYLYNPGSFVTGGYTYGLTATDVQVLDNRSSVFYVALTHKITARVDANLLYQFQYSTYNSNDNSANPGSNLGSYESFNMFGIDFSYKISEFLSAQVGYKYDDLHSDTQGRPYNRHIGFVGLRARY